MDNVILILIKQIPKSTKPNHKTMKKLIIIIIVALTISGCTTRQIIDGVRIATEAADIIITK